MKKLLLIVFSFSFLAVFGQEKKVNFTKDFTYTFFSESPKNEVDFQVLASENNEFLFRLKKPERTNMMIYTEKLGSVPIMMDFDNRLVFSSQTKPGFNSFTEKRKSKNIEYQKLNKQETINGVTCNQYVLKLNSSFTGKNDELRLCLKEDSPYNTLSVLNYMMEDLTGVSFKSDLKGLVLKFGPNNEDEYNKEHIVLKSTNKSNQYAFVDLKKSMMQQQRMYDSLALQWKKQNENFNNIYNEVVVDSSAAVIDSVAIVDSAIAYDDYDYYYSNYESTYKTPVEDGNLAIQNIQNEKEWNSIPKHCRNFEKDLPKFGNEKIGKHLRNYVGQLCDMYLTQNEVHSVGIKITLDEIRREFLELNKLRDELSKSDKTKLDKYLENLD